jgi:hypothetical protein
MKDRKLRVYIVLGAVALILVVATVVLIMQKSTPPTPVNSNISNQSQNEVQILELKDNTKLEIGDRVLTLPEGWVATSFYRNTSNSSLKCRDISDQSNCLVYSISNGMNIFYLSTPSYLVYDETGSSDLLTQQLQLKDGSKKDFYFDKLYHERREDENEGGDSELVTDNDEVILSRAYGCVVDTVCVSSGILNFNSEANKVVLADFKSLISEIGISAK